MTKEELIYVDTETYGRCYTFQPKEQSIKSGIMQIQLNLHDSSNIFFHTNGMFKTDIFTATNVRVDAPSEIELDVDFTLYNMFDFGGKQCTTEPRFNKDACTESKLDVKSLEKFGCTTPFGPKKDKICRDHVNGSKVMALYSKTMEENVDNCDSPCLFVKTKAIKTMVEMKDISDINHEDYGVYLVISFPKNIQVIEAYYLYSTLTMIAEIGGYVGLFLGVSVIQISTLFNAVLEKIGTRLSSK